MVAQTFYTSPPLDRAISWWRIRRGAPTRWRAPSVPYACRAASFCLPLYGPPSPSAIPPNAYERLKDANDPDVDAIRVVLVDGPRLRSKPRTTRRLRQEARERDVGSTTYLRENGRLRSLRRVEPEIDHWYRRKRKWKLLKQGDSWLAEDRRSRGSSGYRYDKDAGLFGVSATLEARAFERYAPKARSVAFTLDESTSAESLEASRFGDDDAEAEPAEWLIEARIERDSGRLRDWAALVTEDAYLVLRLAEDERLSVRALARQENVANSTMQRRIQRAREELRDAWPSRPVGHLSVVSGGGTRRHLFPRSPSSDPDAAA